MSTSPPLAITVDRVSAATAPEGLPMVRLEKLMAVTEASTLSATAMVTASVLLGIPVGFQFKALFQRRLFAPVQVLGDSRVREDPTTA